MEKQKQIVAALAEGNSIRATCRMTGTVKGVILVRAHQKIIFDAFIIFLTDFFALYILNTMRRKNETETYDCD